VLGAAGGSVVQALVQAGSAARRAFALPAPASPAPPLPAGVQVPGNTPFTTAIEDFYRIDITLITPRHEAEGWTLTVDGLVDRPLTIGYDELLAMPMVERDITLTCVSNEVGGSLVGTARWLGVPVATLLERAGVRAEADMVLSHSMDGGFTASTPLEALTDGRDALIALGMNGQVLPDKNGFPARMVVPGLFGYVSATKWLSRLEVTRFDAQTAYWTDRGWSDRGPVLTQSRIDVPSSLGSISPDSPVIAGVAWAQHRGIDKVEIRIDGGQWQETTLADSGGIDTWRQWSFRYDGPPGRHTAEVRATDGTGETQPEQRRPVVPAGATGWHQIQFTLEG
ncbi:molybdopterin-dependent oxidoreductase, partial [Desertihabitans aurantiacus]|uniref:molybdopterin-dependent oxidoreductase n=1 Tax=Desertihabitans aurantiacus TaxID=2282477 RepID=UPI00130065F8